MRRRSSATPSDGGPERRRQPFRPLQPLHSPPLPCTSTPPREVFLTPRATPKPIKRRTASSRLKHAETKVKSEPPTVDTSKARPPSPSDDPLLLSGSHSARTPPLRARFTPAFSSSPSDSSTCADPPASFATRHSGRVGVPDAYSHALPVFSVSRVVEDTGGAWSDSDDDGFNLTGEYTGKYKILKVPTKADPGTREGIESWGRPVSPFPYSEIMERSLPPSDLPEGCSGRHASPYEDVDMWEVATEPPLSDLESSPPPPPPPDSEDEFALLDGDLPLFDIDAESTQVLPLSEPRERVLELDQPNSEKEEEEEEEAQVDRELSVPVDDGCPIPAVLFETGLSNGPLPDESEDEEEDVDEDVIKITSGDPKAAARAAAILRMHDYDCILAAEKKKRSRQSRKRRKTIENAGISKSYTDSKSRRWQPLQGIKTSPGSRSFPLLELWRDAEDSVFLEHNSISLCNTSFTLSPLKAITTRPEILLPPPTGEWTRDCWKCLDKCLTAERVAVAAARSFGKDVFADVGDASKDAVLDRFVNQLGGESVVGGFGPDWSRDNLILRLDVLIKKQSRSAARAPPIGRQASLTEPCYGGLLQQARALSTPLERCPTSTSTLSDTTVVPEPHDAWKTLLDLSWRGSVWTPSRSPDPRPLHPKEQVHLRHASPQKSMIPVPIRPKRLVDLRRLSPTKADGRPWRPIVRRGSGCSVKELVRQYESLDW